LERTYRDEVRALLDFVEHRGGVRLPLAFFAGDPRRTMRDGSMLIRGLINSAGAFEDWVAKLPQCVDLAESRLAFAWELHYLHRYADCLHILDRVLGDKPNLHGALICKADTLVHLQRYPEALRIADRVLAENSREGKAWDIRGNVLAAQQNWRSLLENCDRWLANVPDNCGSRFYAYQHRAVACCGMGHNESMETWITAWANFGGRQRKAEYIRKAVYRRAGMSPITEGVPRKTTPSKKR